MNDQRKIVRPFSSWMVQEGKGLTLGGMGVCSGATFVYCAIVEPCGVKIYDTVLGYMS